jgi:hypothetical protein
MTFLSSLDESKSAFQTAAASLDIGPRNFARNRKLSSSCHCRSPEAILPSRANKVLKVEFLMPF